jgi:hypothetical protein
MLSPVLPNWLPQSSGARRPARSARTLPLAVAALAALGSPMAGAQSAPQPWTPDPVVGAWASEVTQRHCASGAPLGVLKGTLAMHHGGTLSETSSSSPASRGPGFGTWKRQGDGYAARFRLIRYFPDGNLAGYVVISRQFVLSADGQQITGTASLDVQDPAGHTVATGCATETTTRLP